MRITAASLVVLCALAASVQAKSTAQRTASSALRDAADDYCKTCLTANEPHYLPIRGPDEVAFCNDGYYCDCRKGEKVKCFSIFGRHNKFNPDTPNSACSADHDCQKWFHDHPDTTPDPYDPTTAAPSGPTSSPVSPPSPPPSPPTGGTSARPPSPPSGGTSARPPSPPSGGTSARPPGPPGTSSVKPPGPPATSSVKPPNSSSVVPPPKSSSVNPQSSSTTTTTTEKPKPNGASWGQTSTAGLLLLGVVAAVL